MLKNRLVIAIVAMCLILGTVPFVMGATTTSSNQIYISALYVGALHQIPNQEYVKISNKGTTTVNLKGWKIKDSGAKHTYTFPSYTLKAKSTVTLRSGSGKNTATTLYWNKYSFIWNNTGDKAYLYNAQGKLVSSRKG
jgi:Lamin Tail Domain